MGGVAYVNPRRGRGGALEHRGGALVNVVLAPGAMGALLLMRSSVLPAVAGPEPFVFSLFVIDVGLLVFNMPAHLSPGRRARLAGSCGS